MARYELEITRTAEKRLRKLPRDDQVRVARAMLRLASEPRPRGCRKLSGYDDVYRVRAGVYRILYSVSDEVLLIVILKVGQRKDIY